MVLAKILMFKKIYRVISCTALSILLAIILLSPGWSNTNALEKSILSEANGDDSLEIVNQTSSDNKKYLGTKGEEITIDKRKMNELFGDEQIFPFQP